MADELLTTSEVAQMLRMSRKTVSRWVQLGHIQAVRFPTGQLRIPRSEVERLLQGDDIDQEPRRPQPRVPGPPPVKDLAVDVDKRQVLRQGRPVAMTDTEWVVLELLAGAASQIVSGEALRDALGVDRMTSVGSIITHLRRKLEPEPAEPRHIVTVRGSGYRLVT